MSGAYWTLDISNLFMKNKVRFDISNLFMKNKVKLFYQTKILKNQQKKKSELHLLYDISIAIFLVIHCVKVKYSYQKIRLPKYWRMV